MRFPFLVGLLALALGTACGAQEETPESSAGDGTQSSPAEASSTDVEGAWELVSGRGPAGEIDVIEHNRITLVVGPSGGIEGRSACNWYGNGSWSEGKGVGGELVSTLMGCQPDVQASESAYLAAIEDATHAARSGDQLVLTGPSTELEFRRLEPVSLEGLLDRTWVLEEAIDEDGVASPAVGDGAFLRLTANGSYEGSTGCRDFKGTYVVGSGDELTVTSMESEFEDDDEDCPPRLAAQDGIIVSALSGGFHPDAEGDRLTISSSRSGAWAIYRAE